jgi:rhamnogalacturonyl hydrolase YesR
VLASIIATMTLSQSNANWLSRAEETLTHIESNYWRSNHYIQSPSEPHPAFMWDLGMQLSAFAAASTRDKKYIPEFDRALKNIDTYWNSMGPKAGYDVVPNPKAVDRYYDDNAWVALALLEQYETTKNPDLLKKAAETHAYVMSGWDNQLDGGIFWHEPNKASKHTCSNAPAAFTSLKLYQATKEKAYLDEAIKTLTWLDKHLRDSEGLYSDNINLDGNVDKTKWSYNTALPIQAHLLLYKINKDPKDLTAAKESVESAIKHWIGPSGEIKDDAGFAVHLVDAFLAFNDPKYTAIAERATDFAYKNTRTKEGFYANRWDRPNPEKPGNLLAQASALRAFNQLAALNNK